MTSELFKKKLDQAHDLLDQRNYEGCLEILTNLKIRIQDTTIYEKAKQHENKVDESYTQKYKDEAAKHGDPLERFTKSSNFIDKMEKWRVQETLRFYDKLAKQYDL